MDDNMVTKRNGTQEAFDFNKITSAVERAFLACGYDKGTPKRFISLLNKTDFEKIGNVEGIQDKIEALLKANYFDVAKKYILYRAEHKRVRDYVNSKKAFIEKYKQSSNTANATVDDNSNVSSKNIGVLNAEIHKSDNILTSRGMVMDKLEELFPDFDPKQYLRDLESHIIYKHDESSFAGAVAPYCASISMYPFLTGGLQGLGGYSTAPKNIDSFCGVFVNLIFAISSQFAGAIATPEFLLYFDYFARKEWGDDYFLNFDKVTTTSIAKRQLTIRDQIHQYFQQVVYSVNQPAAARGMQSAFWNVSYFDKAFFESMFDGFMFPDMTAPKWESLNWLQKDFMMWYNEERTKCITSFPVESFALIYKDGKFVDEENAKFVADEYSRGHSFFTYISDTADSLASCCRLKNKVQTKEFNFTNGNMGVETGSKSVITLNLSRIVQDYYNNKPSCEFDDYLREILHRVYKYHIAYNELMWDMYDANLLPVYKSHFLNLDKQYLTIGINGLNQAAEFLGIQCNDNESYKHFCQRIFGVIKEENQKMKVKFNGHQLSFNTECVPAESLAIKNYNWDKEDGYWVPTDTNLYASYIYKPNDSNIDVLQKFVLHGRDYIGDYLDGGSAAHINLESHPDAEQCWKLLNYSAQVGCQYFTFNIPNCQCEDCGYIAKQPFEKCPKCGSTNVSLYDRIIGYFSKIKNWSNGRQIEQKTRVYHNEIC